MPVRLSAPSNVPKFFDLFLIYHCNQLKPVPNRTRRTVRFFRRQPVDFYSYVCINIQKDSVLKGLR